MEKIKIYNGEDKEITIVTDIDSVTIPSRRSAEVRITEGAVFQQAEFFVLEAGNYYAKISTFANVDVEIYNAN